MRAMSALVTIITGGAVMVLADTGERAGHGGMTVQAETRKTETIESYADSILKWRANRHARLTSETGWLTVAGLFWLKPGENRIGSDEDNDIVVPAGVAEHAGVFILTEADDVNDARVEIRAFSGAALTVEGESVPEGPARTLATDQSDKADVVTAGRVSLFVIERGGRFAVRMRDPESPLRKNFRGIEYFALDEGYRVDAEFRPYVTPRNIPVPNVMGYSDSILAPGTLHFTLDGVPCTLIPLLEAPTDSSFFIIFSDRTTGSETYGGGRFLYTDLSKDGHVTIDFNRAYNPPCALTPYTTCPLPPEGNDLPIAVRAGEMKYDHHEEGAPPDHSSP